VVRDEQVMKIKQMKKKLFMGLVNTFTVFIELRILVLWSRCGHDMVTMSHLWVPLLNQSN
jgi:hypothetical protein